MWQQLLGKRAGHPRPGLQAACMHATQDACNFSFVGSSLQT